jgi:hypothetical protein
MRRRKDTLLHRVPAAMDKNGRETGAAVAVSASGVW